MTHKIASPFSLKNIEETGEFTGYASIYNIHDSYQDVVKPGAFDRTLKEALGAGRLPKMLWQHDPGQPIGIWHKVESDANGLRVEGRLFLNIQKGYEAYTLLKEGVVDGLSIGYRPLKASRQGKFRLLEDISLFEISLVTFPANDAARVTAVKKDETEWVQLEEALRKAQGILHG